MPLNEKQKKRQLADMFNEANIYYKKGDYDNAKRLYMEILAILPDHSDVLHMLGCVEHFKGEHEQSIAFISRAIKINPGSPLYRNNLGNSLFAQGKYQDALDSFKKAVELKPDYPDGHYNLGLSAMECGNNELAISCFEKVIAMKPDHCDAHTSLGNIHLKLGKLKEAVHFFKKAVQIRPLNMVTNVNLSVALQSSGKKKEAKERLKKALEYLPGNAEILFNLGNIYHNEKQSDKAVNCFEKALESAPDDTRIIYNLATTLMESDEGVNALPFFEKLLTLTEEDPRTLNNMGLIHYTLGNYKKALTFYDRAIKRRPDFSKVFNNIGLACKALEQYDKAIANFKKAIEIAPDSAETYHNLSEILRESDQYEEAAENCRKAIQLQPDLTQANTHYTYLLKWQCEWKEFERITKHSDILIKKEINKNIPPGETPFMNIIRVDDPAYNRKIADAYAKKTEDAVKKLNMIFSFDKNRKKSSGITIGYLSSNFRHHPMAHLLANLFRHHDRNEFKVNCYSLGPDDQSIYRKRFEEDSDLFRDIRNKSHVEAAKLIYDDQVDILVDLMGFTQGNRMEIAALHPAPIQVRYMGLAGTTGGNLFDYIITDEIVTPKEQQGNYSENFIHMPHTYQINDQHKIISDKPMDRKSCNLPEDHFVFCSFNQAYKIDPVIFSTWMMILKSVENSVLWLMPGNATAGKNLLSEANSMGIDGKRIIFAERRALDEHLARLRLADLALDTRTIGGAATTSDALWAGLPVITLLGSRFASRMSASILTALRVEELITHSLDDYKALAVDLALNPPRIARIRRQLKNNTLSMPLFDTPGFTLNLEKAYRKIWQIYLSEKKPQPVDLKKELSCISTASGFRRDEYDSPMHRLLLR